MKVLINGVEKRFNKIETIEDIGSVARQFTLLEKSEKQNILIDDVVEIYNDFGKLVIKGEIEYVEANLDDKTSEFIYAGRNKAKYIVDCYADKTTQFSQGQKINTVLSEIANGFGLEVVGDAQMPKQDMKTILIGNKIIDAFLEIANSVGKIITSDAVGNLLIEFEASDKSDKILEFGTNIVKRKFIQDTTKVFDQYITVAQSNYLVEQTQDVFVKGVYGQGKFIKTKVLQNCLTSQECENISKIEYKKDVRKSYVYTATINTVELDLNTQYFIKDAQLGINEQMNCKTLMNIVNEDTKETIAVFEKVLND
ncbi:MAG: hypothetical protein RBR93_08570 [Aliarcobacter butzleri]|nr:hypothetical protein [Aliarcobacter butzleri]